MRIIECEQETEEWFKARTSVPSSSNFDKIVTTKGDSSKQSEKYMFRLAGERIIGMPEETYQNATMVRGIELEVEARKFYEMMMGVEVKEVGFCISDDGYGCSPDGLVEDDGLIEIKCPIISTQVEYLLDNKLPITYFQQVQGQMLITGRKWVDFISYYPAMKPLVVRVERDNDFLKKLEVELKMFCMKLEEIVNKIK